MTHANNEHQSIVATRVPDDQRLDFLPRHFGAHMMTVESSIYSQFANLCPSYQGGYWHFYELSNGGCYLAPCRESYPVVHAGNYFEATVSGDLAGIIASLFTFSQLSFTFEHDPFGERISTYFYLLRDYALDHPDSNLIVRAID